MVILMIREDETLVGRELEIFAHGISKGVRFAESQLQNKVAAENDDKDRFKKTLSEEYRSGYDEGYIDCSIKWSDLMSSSMRDLDEYECGHIEHEDIWAPDYIRAYKRGYNEGFEDGFDDGIGDVLKLDEGVLDAIYEVREHIKAIQGYARTSDEGNELIHRIIIELYGLQGKVTDLAQMLVMDKVFNYWHKRDVEEY